MNILLVDDNKDLTKALKEILELEGYQIEVAGNGAEALKIAESSVPDIIISDILMPEIDGFKLCHLIKADRKLRKIPFIFYTANYTDPKDKELALSMGASRFIIKPQMPDIFLNVIKEVIQEHREKEIHAPRMPLEEDIELYKMYNQRLTHMLDKKIKDLQKEQHAFFETKKALQLSEDRYKVLLDTIPHGIQEIDLAGLTIYNNKALNTMMNAADKELTGRYIWDLAALESDKELLKKYLEGLVQSQPPPAPYYTQYRTGEGNIISVKMDWNYKKDHQGNVTGFIAVITDITEQKNYEQELKEKMSELENFYEMAVGRELKMKELKSEIERLTSELEKERPQ